MAYTHQDLNKTLHVRPGDLEKDRKRFIIDASGKTLGKLAVEVANKLSGKSKVHKNKFWDAGDFVIVTNVEKVHTTGYKIFQKMYYRYSGWKGNVKSMTLKEMLEKKPADVLKLAVRGMLPKNKMRDRRIKRLKLFVGGNADQYAHLNPQELN